MTYKWDSYIYSHFKLNNSITDEEYKKHIYGAYSSLTHICNKEVSYVELAYKKSIGHSAAKVRKTEYESELNNTISQLTSNLYIS